MIAYDVNDNFDENQEMILFLINYGATTTSSTATTGTTSSSITPPLNDNNEFRSPLGAKLGGRPLNHSLQRTQYMSSSSIGTAGNSTSSSINSPSNGSTVGASNRIHQHQASCRQFSSIDSKEIARRVGPFTSINRSLQTQQYMSSSSTATATGTTSSSITPPLNDNNEFKRPSIGAKIGGRPLSHSLQTQQYMSSSSTATATGTTSSSITPPSNRSIVEASNTMHQHQASSRQFSSIDSKEVAKAKREAREQYQKRLRNKLIELHQFSSATTQASSNLGIVGYAKQDARRLLTNHLYKRTDELHKKKK
jgi:hypothetical protein